MKQHKPDTATLPRLFILLGSLALFLLPFTRPHAHAASSPRPTRAILYVCPGLGGSCYDSIAAALGAASAEDSIYVARGIYTENLLITQSVHLLGGFSGPPLWARDPSAYETIIDGSSHPSSTITLAGTPSAVVEGFIIRNGQAESGGGLLIMGGSPLIAHNTIISNTATGRGGGGIALFGSAASISNNTIIGNTAMGGGGILVAEGSTASFVNNTIMSNTAGLLGGGLLIVGSAATVEGNIIQGNLSAHGAGVQVQEASDTQITNLVDNTIVNNSASGGRGGGINIVGAPLMLERNTLRLNSATAGGGLAISQSDPLILQITATENTAAMGGGLYVEHSSALIDSATVLSNTATMNGGGIALGSNAGVRLTNAIIARNMAQQRGGGLYTESSTPTLMNNTIALNGVDDAGDGIYVGAYTIVTITNNIVVSNTYGIRGEDPSTTMISFNDVYGNSGADYMNVGSIEAGNISLDPLFINSAINDYHLRGESPAIDAGTPIDAPPADHDGVTRPQGGTVDMGAYEYAGPPVPTRTPTPTATATSTATATLTPSPTRTMTPTATATPTASMTTTPTATATPTTTPTPSASATATASTPASATATPSATPTPSRTPTSTPTPKDTKTPTPTASPTGIPVRPVIYLPMISRMTASP